MKYSVALASSLVAALMLSATVLADEKPGDAARYRGEAGSRPVLTAAGPVRLRDDSNNLPVIGSRGV